MFMRFSNIIDKKIISNIMAGLFLLLVLSTSGMSQIPHYEWLKSAGERVYSDLAYSVATDANGNAYVTGQFIAKIAFDKVKLTNVKGIKGNADIFVTKYNTFGQAQWAKRITGSGDEYSRCIAVDASGNSFITGQFSSSTLTSGSFSVSNAGSTDMFVAKLDPNGNALWLRGAGGPHIDSAFAVTVDNSGNAYVIGSFHSPTITFGSFTLTNQSMMGIFGTLYTDIFVVKYDPSGTVVWAEAYGDSGVDEGRDIRVDASGNIYFCGTFGTNNTLIDTVQLKHAGGTHPAGIIYPDLFFAKLNPNREAFWAKSIGHLAADVPFGIGIDNNLNTYIAGSFESDTIWFDSTNLFVSAGFRDCFLAKYDPNGSWVWAKQAGGEFSDEFISLSVDGAGNCYTAGYYESASISFGSETFTNSSSPESKIFLVKYDTDGNLLWAKTDGTTQGVERVYEIAVNGTGTMYAAGSFTSKSMMFDNLTTINSNQNFTFPDLYVVKIYEPAFSPSSMFRTFTQSNLDIAAANTKKTTATFGNARDTVFLRGFPSIKSKNDPSYPGGLILGIARNDSQRAYGWIRFTLKGKTIGDFLLQTGPARGFDILGTKAFVKELKNPMTKKYNNKLAGELAALKMNIAASTHHVTQEGFGCLVFNHPMYPEHVFNGKSMNKIASFVDTMLTYYKLYYASTPTALYDSAAKWLDTINASFAGALAFESTSPIRLTGIKQLSEVSFLGVPSLAKNFASQGNSQHSNIIESYSLSQNYPNPFNPTTNIGFQVSDFGLVTVKVFDVLGREIATLLNQSPMEQGEYEIDFDGSSLASGMYFYKLTVTGMDGKTMFSD
ncbi:MAG: T9SS type A sorting domain-containing protein, partial [Bacteroidetes bacterium]